MLKHGRCFKGDQGHEKNWAHLLLGTLIMGAPSAYAQSGPSDTAEKSSSSISTSFFQGQDPFKEWLAGQGGDLALVYTNDAMSSNTSGGNRRGGVDMGFFEAQLAFDLEKLAGLNGWSFYANVFQLHSTGRFRRNYVGAQNTVAWTEAKPTTRLSELWLEYKFTDNVNLRFGQLAADTEFATSEVSTLFLQSDWSTIMAGAMPNGGPAAPLSTPGARLQIDPTKDTSLLLAVFNGDPAGRGAGEEQGRNPHGLNFRVNDPPLFMAEGQYRLNQDESDGGLASTFKFGAWHHQDDFADQRYGTDGRSLADSASNGTGRPHQGNFGFYSVVDQQLYRPAGVGPDGGISIFNRISVSPSDRNAIDFFVDGGIVFAGLIAARPDDKFGASVIYSRYSSNARGFDRDQRAFTGSPREARDSETSFEITYAAQIVPGWILQPDAQYIRHPSGQTGRDGKVIGLRTSLRY